MNSVIYMFEKHDKVDLLISSGYFILVLDSANYLALKLARINDFSCAKGGFDYGEEQTNVFLSLVLIICVYTLWLVFR